MSGPAFRSQEISGLLRAWSDGEQKAFDELLPLVYNELRRQAHRVLRRERRDHTLQTTALINEAYLVLVDQHRVRWRNREHFFAISANMMRRILVNYANARNRRKRGGSVEKLQLDETIQIAMKGSEVDLLELNQALKRLARMDRQQEQIVELRYFGGLTIEQTAAVLDVSPATIKRDWKVTKAWLYRELSGKDGSREVAKD